MGSSQRHSSEAPWTGPELLGLLSNLPGMVYQCRNDAEWTMVFVSAGCEALTGVAARDLIGNRLISFGELIHPDDRARVWETVQAALDVGEPFQVTYRICRPDGQVRWVWEQGSGIGGPRGGIDSIEGFITDITESAELERRVRAQQGQFHALADQGITGVYLIREGRFAFVNERIAQLFGYTVDEMLALPGISDVIHPADRDRVAENVRKRLDGETASLHYEFRGVTKSGRVFDVEVEGRPVETDEGPAVLGVLLDVTERNRAQRRYHETQKKEAIAELASGVAHDFNNILATIGMLAQLMADGAEDEAARDLHDVQEAVRRGARLCKRLMAFGASRSHGETSTGVGAVLSDLTPILERLLARQGVRLSVSVPQDLPPVRIDVAQLEQVAMNLVLNAGDASPEDAEVELSSALEKAPDGENVVLRVRDRGAGIAPEHLERIFEPYFSTKGEKGNGLGLRNVWCIVTNAGGTVVVDSELGRGSTFSVSLPTDRRRSPRS